MVVFDERIFLNKTYVCVVTQYSCHVGFSKLVQLSNSETLIRIVSIFIVESIAIFQITKLFRNYTFNRDKIKDDAEILMILLIFNTF